MDGLVPDLFSVAELDLCAESESSSPREISAHELAFISNDIQVDKPFRTGDIHCLNEHEVMREKLCLDALNLPRLYRISLLPFLSATKQEKLKSNEKESNFPDWKNSENDEGFFGISALQKMNSFFKNHQTVLPSPFALLRYHVEKEYRKINSIAKRKAHGSTLYQPVNSATAVENSDFSIRANWEGHLDGDALFVAVSLTNMQFQSTEGLNYIFCKLRQRKSIALGFSSSQVKGVLEHFYQLVKTVDEALIEKTMLVASITGLIVGPRGDLRDCFTFLRHLEDLDCAVTKISEGQNLPFCDSVVRSFEPKDYSTHTRHTPLDYNQDDQVPFWLPLCRNDGAIQCIAISADGKRIAAVVGAHLFVISGSFRDSFPHSNPEVKQETLSELFTECWSIFFTSSSFIVITSKNGLNHIVFSEDLTIVHESSSTVPSLAIDWKEDESSLALRHAPHLPFGSCSSLYLFQNNCGIVKHFEETLELNRLTVAVLANIDYSGSIASFEAHSGNYINISILDGTIELSFCGNISRTVLSKASQWFRLHVQWCEGRWLVFQSGGLCELHGVNEVPQKQIEVRSCSVLGGKGHIGALAVWSSANEFEEKQGAFSFFRRDYPLRVETPLIYLPLDEGMGFAIKDLSTLKCISLNSSKDFMWDTSDENPSPTHSFPLVQMSASDFVSRNVMKSAYCLYFLPSETYGDRLGCTDVTEVDAHTNVISRLYRSFSAFDHNIYSLRDDEEELIFCDPRFFTFGVINLHSPKALQHRSMRARRLERPLGSPGWAVDEISSNLYVYCSKIQETEWYDYSNHELEFIYEEIRSVTPRSNTSRVMALLSFATLYLKGILGGKVSLSVNDLPQSLQKLIDYHRENQLVYEEATSTLDLAQRCLYSMEEKLCMLLTLPLEEKWDLFFSVFDQNSLHSVLHYAVEKKFTKDIISLTKYFVEDQDSNDNEKRISQWITFYIYGVVDVLLASGEKEALCEIIAGACAIVDSRLQKWEEKKFCMQHCMLKCCILPLFIIVMDACPGIISISLQKTILSIIGKLRKSKKKQEETFSFHSTSIYEVSKLSDESSSWCFTEDFSNAEAVIVQKDNSSPTFTVLSQRLKELDSTVELVSESVSLKGDVLLFSGRGKNVITTTSTYQITVENSLVSVLLECLEVLLTIVGKNCWFTIPSDESFRIPLAFRHGLTTSCLKKYGIDIPKREVISTYSREILEGIEEGQTLVDTVCHSMRGSILPSMRPAIQALLSILIHCGATEHEAEKELRINWFSGNWGINFQGPKRIPAIEHLHKVASWVVENIFFDRTLTTSLNRSQSKYSTTASSVQTTVYRFSAMKDLLASIRSMIDCNVAPEEIELKIAHQTKRAANFRRGADLMCAVLQGAEKGGVAAQQILSILSAYLDATNSQHIVETMFGAGIELEGKVRLSFHEVLRKLMENVTKPHSQSPSNEVDLIIGAFPKGFTLLQIVSLCYYPWDEEDFSLMVNGASGAPENSEEIWLLKNLYKLMRLPFNESNGEETSSNASFPMLSYFDDEARHRHCVAAVYDRFHNFSSSNGFSICAPHLTVTVTQGITTIFKRSEERAAFLADEPWEVDLDGGANPSLQYYEVCVQTVLAGPFFIGLTSGEANPEEAESNFLFALSSDGKLFPVEEKYQQECFPAKTGDVIGCGLYIPQKEVFYTRNGVFWRSVGKVEDKEYSIFPSLLFPENSTVKVDVNFGGRPFVFDTLKMHPSLLSAKGPTWYNLFCAAKAVSHFIISTVSTFSAKQEDSDVQFFKKQCCDAACESLIDASRALLRCSASEEHGDLKDDSMASNMRKSVMFKVAESTILLQLESLRQLFCSTGVRKPLPLVESSTVFSAISLVMALPIQSTLVAVLRLLGDVVGEISGIPEEECKKLVKLLFIYAATEDSEPQKIAFKPQWDVHDVQNVSIVKNTTAVSLLKTKVNIVLGSVLPATGEVSFTVSIKKAGSPKGRSLQSGYYIGVARKGRYPSDLIQSWKTKKPTAVWALHDVSPQLPYATNPSVEPNLFMRAYGSGEMITVHVDRINGTVGFSRENKFLSTLFVGLPSGIDLVPFIQMYNEGAIASIFPGSMTSPITEAALLGAVSVDVLRRMLQVQCFEKIVAEHLRKEMQKKKNPKVTYAVLNGVPDPRRLQLTTNCDTKKIAVKVIDISKNSYIYLTNNGRGTAAAHRFRTPGKTRLTCSFDVQPQGNISGLSSTIEGLIEALIRYTRSIIMCYSFFSKEINERNKIILEESRLFDILRESLRVGLFQTIQYCTPETSFVPVLDLDYVFSIPMSNPYFEVVPQFMGKLIKLQSSAPTLSTFIGIADPFLPSTGYCNLRCRIRRNDDSYTLGGGYYFGVCCEGFSWSSTDFVARSDATPLVWALHDKDVPDWRLRHMNPGVTFDDNICFYSGDTIRLGIDRDEGTMSAYRKPYKGDEIFLGVIFTDIPKVPLRAFVRLFNNDASAVLLSSSSDQVLARVPQQHMPFATFDFSRKVFCSSCSMNQVEEGQLTEDWYKCNECVNYSLCSDCFYRCIHHHHTFTLMNARKLLAFSTSPPWKLAEGMRVFSSPSSTMFLRSSSCFLQEDFVDSVAVSTGDNAFACWGLVGKANRFVVSITTKGENSRSADYPVFVGITSSEKLLLLNAQELRTFVNEHIISNNAEAAIVCSDPLIDESEKSNVFGFSEGSTVSFHADWNKGIVRISKDWVRDRDASLFLDTSKGKQTSLFGFVLFGREGQTAKIFPDQPALVTSVVSEVNGNMITLKNSRYGSRVVTKDQCRMPLAQLAYQKDIVLRLLKQRKPLSKKVVGYVFEDSRLAQCEIVEVSDNRAVVEVEIDSEEKEQRKLELHQVLIDPYQTPTTPYRKLNSTGLSPDAYTVSSVFKILFILSCMCTNELLMTIISRYKQMLVPVLESLSSVQCTLLKPTNVVECLRKAIQTPFLWYPVPKHTKLSRYSLTYLQQNSESEISPGSLVFTLQDSKRLFRVQSCSEDVIHLIALEDNQTLAVSPLTCGIVKQSCNRPWPMVRNSLPTSKREYTMRKKAGSSSTLTTVEGHWKGWITTKSLNMHLDLFFKKPGGFKSEATVQFKGSFKRFIVFYEYFRYERLLKIFMLSKEKSIIWKSLENKKWDEIVHETDGISSLSDHVYIIRGLLDSSGIQFSGCFHYPNGSTGSVFARLRTSLSLVTESTHEIEVLSTCVKTEREVPIRESEKYALLSDVTTLLCRHLNLCLCYRNQMGRLTFASNIDVFHMHPLALQLAQSLTPELTLQLILRAMYCIKLPDAEQAHVASLASFILVPLLNENLFSQCPSAFIWEALHAVIFAAHKCGPILRPRILELLRTVLSSIKNLDFTFNYEALLAPLFSYANNEIEENGILKLKNLRNISSIIELILDLPVQLPNAQAMERIPINTLLCLLDIQRSIMNCEALPAAVDTLDKKQLPETKIKCLFGEVLEKNLLKVGKIVGECVAPRKKVYFEVVLALDEEGTYAIGWGTEQHRRAADKHVGTDSYSFAFLGNSVCFGGVHHSYSIPLQGSLGKPKGTVIGCLLDLVNGQAAWSRNGVLGNFIPIPSNHLGRDPLFPFASINGGSGLSFFLDAKDFLHAPDDFCDISGEKCLPVLDYDPQRRSLLLPQPKTFFIQLSDFLSLTYASRTTKETVSPDIKDYSLVAGIDEKLVPRYESVLRYIEYCVHTAGKFVDLDGDKVAGSLSSAFLFFKPILREVSRLKFLHSQELSTSVSPKEITVKLPLSPKESRTAVEWPTESVLCQCYKQLFDLPDEQWSKIPLFRVRLYLSNSGHYPIDMGGPYRQTWSLIAQEIMLHPETRENDHGFSKCSLFRLCNNSQRVSLVPDESMKQTEHLNLFFFFGQLLGYAAKTQLSLDIEFSPFVWKYMVDDKLKINDYYFFVDSVVRDSMEDSEFFSNGMAEEIIPSFSEELQHHQLSNLSPDAAFELKKNLAQKCLLHSMDLQLNALRRGVWKVLSRRILRCMYWKDLEELVCGVADPTVAELQKYFKCNLSPSRTVFFWKIVSEMTPKQKSSLLCFASGQRRLPLLQPISIVENSESEEHLPRAQSCSSLIAIPLYQTIEKFREKLLHALEHHNEMELA